MGTEKVKIVDATGSFCPGPLMELIAELRDTEIGAVVELLSSDKGSAQDVPVWVNKVGHEMLGSEEQDGIWHIRVRKKK